LPTGVAGRQGTRGAARRTVLVAIARTAPVISSAAVIARDTAFNYTW
jgi:hypothetical protein